MPQIVKVALKVGLEIHVELSTRTKMFSRCPNPASAAYDGAEPNTLIDPVVLGLPGALPVINKAAVEMSIMVGMALGCSIAPLSRWDRKSYFYPDMPKNYQISQYQLPLCFDGCVEIPATGSSSGGGGGGGGGGEPADDDAPPIRIGIIRAHLEEDAGKLLHEAPGGGPLDCSIVDLNRAGTPLLEIVTQPDFTSADQVVVFCQALRNICRFLGVTEGIMQKGHMRFEPNINTVLTLDDGHVVHTPIVEIKNLNSFKSVRGAIEYELREQPGRWLADGRVMGPNAKSTRGWDDSAGGTGQTFLQREKEDAHDYRYFPDPDLLPVAVSDAWRESVRARIPELPLSRLKRYVSQYGLSGKEAAAITDERDVCSFYEACVSGAGRLGVVGERAGRLAANFLLQSGAKRANERAASGDPVLISDLGISPSQVAGIIRLREDGALGSNQADELFGLLCLPEHRESDPAALAQERGLLIVRDEGAMDRWCDQAIAEHARAAEDVRAGKLAAIGRLVGAAMKLSGGQADAAAVRQRLLARLGQG